MTRFEKFDVEGLDESDPRRRLNAAYRQISLALDDIDGSNDPPTIPVDESRDCVVGFDGDRVRFHVDGETVELEPGTATLVAFAIEAGVLDLNAAGVTPD